MTDQDFEQFLFDSAVTELSMPALRPLFPRWRSFLLSKGIPAIPSPRSTAPADARAVNLMSLLVKQAMLERNSAGEHALRDLTLVRPYKG
jgi:hypothetical protein